MAFNYKKFDDVMDIQGLQNDVDEAAENGGNREEVPHGDYEVKIEKMELDESKKGDPMFVCWMRILNGEFKNSMIFMYQVINKGFQIHIVNEFLRSLDSGINSDDIKFKSFKQYEQLIMNVHEEIDGQLEYALKYDEKKGFNTFKITEVYDA